MLLLCDGGDLCVELSERLCAWVEGPLSGGVDEQQPDVSAVKMAEAAAGVAVKLLGRWPTELWLLVLLQRHHLSEPEGVGAAVCSWQLVCWRTRRGWRRASSCGAA